MQKSSAMNQFVEQIKNWMSAEGLTQRAAADLMGIDQGNLSKILNGHEGVTIDRAEQLASRCGLEFCVNLIKSGKISAA